MVVPRCWSVGCAHCPRRVGRRCPAGARWARAVVTCPPSIRGAVDTLLHDVVVLGTDVADAAAVGSAPVAQHPDLTVVTADGDRIAAAAVEGGSARRTSSLEVQSAIDAATTELAHANRTAEEVGAALAGALTEQDDRSGQPTRRSPRCTSRIRHWAPPTSTWPASARTSARRTTKATA